MLSFRDQLESESSSLLMAAACEGSQGKLPVVGGGCWPSVVVARRISHSAWAEFSFGRIGEMGE